MSRVASLNPKYLSGKSIWYLSIPPSLSVSGKRQQEYFKTKKEALNRATILKNLKQSQQRFAQKCSPALMEAAVECDELAQMYGYAGLREAFIAWSQSFEKTKTALTLKHLMDLYEKDHAVNWSQRYLTNRWKPFCRMIESIETEVIPNLSTDFWREWLGKYREDKNPAVSTYNQNLAMLRAIFRHEKAKEYFHHNPIESIPSIKSENKEVCVASPDEVQSLMEWTWNNDRDLIPYFALGFFAGLRPLAEIEPLQFSQILFSEKVINVISTKTKGNPRRQTPMEENLQQWLAPFEGKEGLVCPPNLRRRIDKARKESGIKWGHDIMRHSYGSYWEANNRNKSGCREQLSYNMGHSTFKTYEQHYRNDRTPDQGAIYWSITPF